ncbi:hypothetical protein OAR75_02645 [Candidatus Pelagibacter sp.]|nr:hypothetical protein [Candidatus Pelagibacter sp.]
MSKKLIIGVIGRNSIGPWIIPRKIQTLICHNTNLKKNEKISFLNTEYIQSSGIPNLVEYIKKNKKFIKKITFISIFQLGKNEKEIFDNLKKIKLYDSYFYLESLNNKNLNLRLLKNYIKEFLNMKYYPVKKFNFN